MKKALFVLTCAAAALSAQEKQQPKPATQNGMKAYKDPVTGEFRAPTAEELRLEAQQARAAVYAEPVPVVRKDGSVSVMLNDSHMSYAVMVKNADGTLTMQCVTGDARANSFVQTTKPAVNFSAAPAPAAKERPLDQ